MHESSLMTGLVHTAEEAARDAGAARVARIRVRVGALSGMSPQHLREHFDEAAAGTLLTGAILDIEYGPDGLDALDDPAAQGVLLLGIDVEDA